MSAVSLEEAKKQGAVLVWGNFVTIAINYTIIAAALFVAVKGMNYLKRKDEAKVAVALPPPSKQEVLLTDIRNLLQQR